MDARRVVVGGALTDGGSVVQWARELMGISSDQELAELMAEAATIEPTAHGLTVLPFLVSERA